MLKIHFHIYGKIIIKIEKLWGNVDVSAWLMCNKIKPVVIFYFDME